MSKSTSELNFIKPTFEQETLVDGTTVLRRLEAGNLVETSERRTLASGCELLRRYDAQMQLVEEIYGYGIHILLTRCYQNGQKISETYLYHKRLVSKRSYEKARLDYPDMPAADASLHDTAAALNKLIKLERALLQKTASVHVQDRSRAMQNDLFCQHLIDGDEVIDAYGWLALGGYTLGEMSRAQSKRLLMRLQHLGCPAVYACEVEELGARAANSGNLVVELPVDMATRGEVFQLANRIVTEQGFEPELDDGQRYVYIKLD